MTNSLEQPSAFSTPRHSGHSMSEGLSRASTAIAYGSLTTVYIADVRAPSELNVFAHLSATEPDAFFIPSWLKPTLVAHFGFDMESKETWSSGRARPPKSYRFIHRSTRERFVLHLGRCNDSLLCAHVSIRPASPQDRTRDYADGVPYNPSSISPLPTPCPNYDPTFSTVYHVNSWPNGSLSFGDSRRTVTLTATRWPHDHSYCLEVRLGGRVYADLRQRQRSRPSSDLQAQLEHSGWDTGASRPSSMMAAPSSTGPYYTFSEDWNGAAGVVLPEPDAFFSSPFEYPQWATATPARAVFRSLQIPNQVNAAHTPFTSVQLQATSGYLDSRRSPADVREVDQPGHSNFPGEDASLPLEDLPSTNQQPESSP